jgi:hypothetical protein
MSEVRNLDNQVQGVMRTSFDRSAIALAFGAALGSSIFSTVPISCF